MRTIALVAAILAGTAFAAPAGAATPPPAAAAHHPGAVIHAAPSSSSDGAMTPDAQTAAQPPLAPSMADSVSSNLKPAPSWVPRMKQNQRAKKANNWSGYADDAIPGSYFELTYSQWTEPNFTCDSVLSKHGSETSQWIGIDGNASSDPALEQDGTIEGCGPHGNPYVDFFWETIPGPPHLLMAGGPGDTIEASVTYLGNNEFQFIVIDETKNQTMNVTEPCASSAGCPLASTEAIAEWPGKQLKSGITLTRYGAFPFYNFYATNYYAANGLTYDAYFAPSTLWSSAPVETVGPKPDKAGSRIVQSPGQLFAGDREFWEYWRHAY
jgi:hypothetical protein